MNVQNRFSECLLIEHLDFLYKQMLDTNQRYTNSASSTFKSYRPAYCPGRSSTLGLFITDKFADL